MERGTLPDITRAWIRATVILVLISTAFAVQSVNAAPSVRAANYPPDPKSDIPWSAGHVSITDIQEAFNTARSTENGQLGVYLRPIMLPNQATWNAMNSGEKALWLINEERAARGLLALHGLETNVQSVARSYAAWLLANNKFDHNADGRTPWQRLYANPAINACHDPLGVAENLDWKGTTSPDGVPMAVEQAVYGWIYDDSGSAWLHRHAILWEPIEDNGGPVGLEGFLGIGHVRGGFTDPVKKQYFPNTDLVVMNIFDPCAAWTYTAPPDIAEPPPPQDVKLPDPPANTHSVSGNAAAPTWVTIARQPFETDTWPGQWQASDATGATNGEFQWSPRTCRVYDGTYSGMAAGGGVDGSLQFCEDHYPNNARSWLIYGPFSLADAIAADLRARVWVNTEPNTDLLCLMTSIDGKQYHGICVSGSSGGWAEERLDLNKVIQIGSVLGRSQVYVAVVFWSNESVTYPGQGGFVDNIELRKAVAGATLGAFDEQASSGDALYGVTITADSGQSTLTDRGGAFTLAGLPPGQHTLTASKPGYQFYPPITTVNLAAGDVGGVRFVGTTSVRHTVYIPFAKYSR